MEKSASNPGSIPSCANPAHPVPAPRGSQISCKSWQQEAALRLLMNSYDPEVAGEAHDGDSVNAVVESLRVLENDETLFVRNGIPAGVFKMAFTAPRVLILDDSPEALSASGESFHELNRLGHWAFGEAAGEGWVSAGDQDVLHGTYQTFALAAQKHFKSDLAGKFVVAGGMGRLGGAQPLAATMNGAAFLGVEADAEKILGRIRSGYCDICVNDLDEALRILKNAVRQKQPVSVGLAGNCAEVIPELARRGVVPDLLTDQTPAHDPHNGYIPAGLGVKDAAELRQRTPQDHLRRSRESMAQHRAGILELQKLGAVAFEFGNGICAAGSVEGGATDAASFPDLVSAYLLPAFRAGLAPVRCFALSGERGDIYKIDERILQLFPGNEMLTRWLRMAKKHVKFQGLPARVCWLEERERPGFGVNVNDLVARGALKAPIAFGCEYFDRTVDLTAAREPQGVKDARGAVSESTITKALLNAAAGASWASFHRGAGNGKEEFRFTSQVVAADGSPEMARRLSQILAAGGVVKA